MKELRHLTRTEVIYTDVTHIFLGAPEETKEKRIHCVKKGKNHFSSLWKIENTMEIHRYYQNATILPILEELGSI